MPVTAVVSAELMKLKLFPGRLYEDGERGDEPLLRIEFCGLSVGGLPNEF